MKRKEKKGKGFPLKTLDLDIFETEYSVSSEGNKTRLKRLEMRYSLYKKTQTTFKRKNWKQNFLRFK